MTRPLLGFALDRPASPGLATVARVLGQHARTVTAPEGEVAGWLATSPAAPRPGSAPVVAWWQPGDPQPAEASEVLLVGAPPVPSGVLAVWDGPDLARRPALSPFLRSRWRWREGLPDDLVLVASGSGVRVVDGDVVPESGVPAAWALAGAAAVTGPMLAEALSWAVPCVTDRASADAIGAEDGVDVVVAEPDLVPRARALAGDWPTAARVSRGARRWAERDDISAWLGPVLSHLGLSRGCGPTATPLADRLAELVTPSRSHMCERAAAAVAGWG